MPRKYNTNRPRPRDPALRQEMRREVMVAFLAAYEAIGNGRDAAKEVGYDVATFYKWKYQDPQFEAEWNEVVKVVNDRRSDEIRAELHRRGIEGVLEPVFFKGQRTGHHIRRYSDQCLIMMAKMRCPEAREHVDVSVGGNGKPIVHAHRLEPEKFGEVYGGVVAKVLERRAIAATGAGDDSSRN